MNIILLLIGLLNLGLLIYFLQRSDDTRPALREMLEDHEDHLTDQLTIVLKKKKTSKPDCQSAVRDRPDRSLNRDASGDPPADDGSAR